MPITSTDIVTQYGSKYLNNGQTQNDILSSFKRTRTIPNYATKRFTQNDVLQLAAAEMGNVLQPFQATYTHKGNVTVVANEIRLRKLKVDQLITPDEIEGTWLAFMASLTDAERANWPMVRYIWEKLLAELLQQDHEHCDWAGEYAAPTAGTAGGHLTSYDGLKKLITVGLASTTNPMNAVTLGNDPTDATEAFAALEEFANALPGHWRNRQVDIYVSEDVRTKYFRDRRNTHGNDFNFMMGGENRANMDEMTLDGFRNWRLVPFGGMDMAGDQGWIFACPRANIVHATKTASWRMGMDKVDRQVKAFADWYEGLGFLVNKMVYAYNPEASGS